MSQDQKIRPPKSSPPELRGEAERGLEQIARAPDIGGPVQPDIGPGPISASLDPSGVARTRQGPADPEERTIVSQQPGNLTLSPEQAAAMRAQHNEPNRLGRTFKPNDAELAMNAYQKRRAAWKDSYAKERDSNRTRELEEEMYEAKRACIQLGLMSAG
jgi:hypothetical protein